MVTVALDAMGGDLGLDATVAGAASLSRESVDIRVLLVGPVDQVSAKLDQIPYDPRRLTLVDSGPAVPMDRSPKVALQEMPDCSIAVATRLVAEGEADALVSAGHTGATILAAATFLERIPGIRRAALASVYPTELRHGPHKDPFALILDAGATLAVSEEELVAFAIMGSAYSSVISGIPSPKVALLANGTEPNKGTPAIRAAHQRLAGSSLNFAGNIEGLDIPRGTVDVVVTDGFTGNVVLKMLEGFAEMLGDVAKDASVRRLQWRIGLTMLGGGIRKLKRRYDWKSYGGAPLLGLDHVVIKAHGRSEARAIRNAIKVAAKAVNGDLIGRIRRGCDELGLQDGPE